VVVSVYVPSIVQKMFLNMLEKWLSPSYESVCTEDKESHIPKATWAARLRSPTTYALLLLHIGLLALNLLILAQIWNALPMPEIISRFGVSGGLFLVLVAIKFVVGSLVYRQNLRRCSTL
jgi:hypothetical protein